MTAQAEENSYPVASQPCNGQCSGFGTRSCCPPLIVLAMHSESSASTRSQTQSHPRPASDETHGSPRLGHFGGALASGEFCNCTFGYLTNQAGQKTLM
jgi:hypothetical protein